MKEIQNYFNNNKEKIFNFVKDEKHIYPKLFVNTIEKLFDENFYENLKNENNVFNYFFSLKNIQIFNIMHINDIYYHKSDIFYKNIYLFFSNEYKIYLNDKKEKDIFIVNSVDSIFIKNADFLKISYLEKEEYNYEDINITYYEKNLFDKILLSKYTIKNVFLKKF